MNPSAATCVLAWRRNRRFPTSGRCRSFSVVIEAHLWKLKLSIRVLNVCLRGILRGDSLSAWRITKLTNTGVHCPKARSRAPMSAFKSNHEYAACSPSAISTAMRVRGGLGDDGRMDGPLLQCLAMDAFCGRCLERQESACCVSVSAM